MKHIAGKFRQFAIGHQRRCVDDEWRKNFRVTLLARVNVEKEICQRAFEPRACSPIQRETRASNFYGAFQIQNPSCLTQFPVRFGREIEFRRRAPASDFDVAFRAATRGHRAVRDIRDGEHEVAQIIIKLRDFRVFKFDFFANLFHPRGQRAGVLTRLFKAADVLAAFVALRFQAFDGGDALAALGVDFAKSVEVEARVAILRHALNLVQMLAKIIQINHRSITIAKAYPTENTARTFICYSAPACRIASILLKSSPCELRQFSRWPFYLQLLPRSRSHRRKALRPPRKTRLHRYRRGNSISRSALFPWMPLMSTMFTTSCCAATAWRSHSPTACLAFSPRSMAAFPGLYS